MKKKLKLICITVVIAALCISFLLWWNRTIRVVDIIDYNTITKVEIIGDYDYVILTEKEDIKELTDIFDSMKLKRGSRCDVEGGATFDIYLYHENNNINNVFVRVQRNCIDGKWYKGDRCYYYDILKFYDKFPKHDIEELPKDD